MEHLLATTSSGVLRFSDVIVLTARDAGRRTRLGSDRGAARLSLAAGWRSPVGAGRSAALRCCGGAAMGAAWTVARWMCCACITLRDPDCLGYVYA